MWSFVVGCLVVLAIAFFITDRVLDRQAKVEMACAEEARESGA